MHLGDDLRSFESGSSDGVDDVANANSIEKQQEPRRFIIPYKGDIVLVEQLLDLQLES